MVKTAVCTWASQNGKAPLKCSIMMPVNRWIGPMNHDRAFFETVFVGIFELKSLRHKEIKLNCAALPETRGAVFYVKINFGSIEGPVAPIEFEFNVQIL